MIDVFAPHFFQPPVQELSCLISHVVRDKTQVFYLVWFVLDSLQKLHQTRVCYVITVQFDSLQVTFAVNATDVRANAFDSFRKNAIIAVVNFTDLS